MASKTPEHVIKLIEKATEEKATFLDLGNCGLTEVPEEISLLATHIIELNFGWSYRKKDKWVETVNTYSNNNFSLHPGSLQILRTLPQLKALQLRGNSIGENGAQHISQLTGLTSLDISDNSIGENGAQRISQLTGLTSLDISDNSIGENGAQHISQLTGLTSLDIHSNSIGENGAQHISQLTGLTSLDISYNSIGENGAQHISQLTGLTSLDIRSNSIGDNGLKELINGLPYLTEFDFSGNKTKTTPPEILKNLQALRDYFIIKTEKVDNTLVKMILLGNTGAGKTKLATFLTEKKYNTKHESTHGINSLRWGDSQSGLQVNIWAFGGQDYFHATHNLLLGHNGLYVLLHTNSAVHHAKDNLEENQYHSMAYWLGNLQDMLEENNEGEQQDKKEGKQQDKTEETKLKVEQAKTKLLLVQNKRDHDKFEKEWPGKELPQGLAVNNYFNISIEQAFNNLNDINNDYTLEWNYFYRHLLNELNKLKGTEQIPETWVSIRDIHLPQWRGENVQLTQKDFINACEKALSLKQNQIGIEGLLTYLAGCGEIIEFKKPGLQGKIFLSVKGLFDFLYEQVLTQDVRKNGGNISTTSIKTQKGLTATDIIQLLEEYKLIFKHPAKEGVYIAPQYLPENVHAKHFERLVPLSFAIRFPYYFSRSLISRFISKYAAKDKDSFFWRYGVFFDFEGCNCFVRMDVNTQTVYVHTEDKKNKYNALKEIFNFLTTGGKSEKFEKNEGAEKNQDKLTIKIGDNVTDRQLQRITLSIDGENFAPALEIKEAINNKAYRVKCSNGNYTEIPPLYYQLLEQNRSEPKRIFFSYSKRDRQYLDELNNHFAALKRSGKIDTWFDADLEPGEEWDKKIKDELDKADIVLLLLSPDFMATDYIWDIEIPRIQKAGKNLLPVFLRPCDWHEEVYEIDKYTALPAKGDWIIQNSKPNRDEDYLKVIEGIKKLLN